MQKLCVTIVCDQYCETNISHKISDIGHKFFSCTYMEQLQSLDSKKSQRRKCLQKVGPTVILPIAIISRRSPQNILSLSKLASKIRTLLLPSFHYFGSLINGKQRRPQIKVKHHIFEQFASKVTPFLFLQVIRISSFENP